MSNYVKKDHPRLRGEYLKIRFIERKGIGSSPLARGILVLNEIIKGSTGIIPACAGNTLFFTPVMVLFRDHPRLRGEYQITTAALMLI